MANQANQSNSKGLTSGLQDTFEAWNIPEEYQEMINSGLTYVVERFQSLDPEKAVDFAKRHWKPIVGTAFAAGAAAYFISRRGRNGMEESHTQDDEGGRTDRTSNLSRAARKQQRAKQSARNQSMKSHSANH